MSDLPKNPVIALYEAAIMQTEAELAKAERNALIHKTLGAKSVKRTRQYEGNAAMLKQRLHDEKLLLRGAKSQAESSSIHTSFQKSENAKGQRRPKLIRTDEDLARAKAKAKDLWPEILASTPEGHGQISRALEKVMNNEFASGKRIGTYVDKESLRQTLTRKKSCKSGAST